MFSFEISKILREELFQNTSGWLTASILTDDVIGNRMLILPKFLLW